MESVNSSLIRWKFTVLLNSTGPVLHIVDPSCVAPRVHIEYKAVAAESVNGVILLLKKLYLNGNPYSVEGGQGGSKGRGAAEIGLWDPFLHC